jgi:hypothetical protein
MVVLAVEALLVELEHQVVQEIHLPQHHHKAITVEPVKVEVIIAVVVVVAHLLLV